MNNKTRALVRIVQEICSEKDIHCTSFSHNWILKLTKDDRSGIIFGYNFGLNSSSSAALCKDKCAASEVLAHSRIPHIGWGGKADLCETAPDCDRRREILSL